MLSVHSEASPPAPELHHWETGRRVPWPLVSLKYQGFLPHMGYPTLGGLHPCQQRTRGPGGTKVPQDDKR